MFEAKVEQVIITTLSLRGDGTEANGYRKITEIWRFDGTKIAEVDPFKEQSEDATKD